MRRSCKDTKVIVSPIVEGPSGPTGGQVIGINLGWDFVAEHEFGIRGICDAFGIAGKPERRGDAHGTTSGDLVGADVRTVTKVPNSLRLFEFADAVYLVYAERFDPRWMNQVSKDHLDSAMEIYRKNDAVCAAWSGRDFGVRLKKTDADKIVPIHTMILGQVYEAFKNKDAMIFLGGRSGPFGNSGLTLTIRSRMPEDVLQKMKEADEDYLDLTDAVLRVETESGVRDKLKAAGKSFYALSPRWAKSKTSTDAGKTETVYPIVYWLNPEDQRKYAPGLYTIEQLLEWAGDKGPVLRTKTAR